MCGDQNDEQIPAPSGSGEGCKERLVICISSGVCGTSAISIPVTRLLVDYVGLMRDLFMPLVAADVGPTLFGAVAERENPQDATSPCSAAGHASRQLASSRWFSTIRWRVRFAGSGVSSRNRCTAAPGPACTQTISGPNSGVLNVAANQRLCLQDAVQDGAVNVDPNGALGCQHPAFRRQAPTSTTGAGNQHPATPRRQWPARASPRKRPAR